MPAATLSRRQLWGLLALTLMWGVNWPMMKLSLQEMPPLYFRASTMCLGAAWLFVYVRGQGERMWPRRDEWATIAWLGLPNVLGWHTLSIFGVQELASGRAAILGFTMPIFTVLIGAAFFGERITPRVRLAVVCVSLAIGLLLWHELQRLTRMKSLRLALRMMRGPAQAGGLGALHAFLERGFEAFSHMGDASGFLAAVEQRESHWMDVLFDDPQAARQLAPLLGDTRIT